jgi:hypothetical protein
MYSKMSKRRKPISRRLREWWVNVYIPDWLNNLMADWVLRRKK